MGRLSKRPRPILGPTGPDGTQTPLRVREFGIGYPEHGARFVSEDASAGRSRDSAVKPRG